jgi:hypothetical protein
MAVDTIEITSTWQLISSTACTITAVQRGIEPIEFNEVASDTNKLSVLLNITEQVQQTEVKNTYARSDVTWVVRVDEEGA